MSAKYNIKTICNDSNSIWHKLRWSHTGGLPTCSCGCSDLYHLSDGRYKCKHCRKVFSDRTGTLLQHSKLPTWVWLVSMYKFSVCKEFSAIDLSKLCSVSYPTAYMVLQKLRMVAGLDKQVLEGIINIDESYIGGWSDMHFNKKIEFMKKAGYMAPNATRYDKTKLLRASSAKKFHTLSITDESGRSLLIHCPNPITKATIRTIITDKMTGIVSDESSLYKGLGIPVYQSNHSKHIFMTPEGYTSNICECNFSWVKRKWNGVFSHTSEKYLQLYLWQRQWSYNHIGMSSDKVFSEFVKLCSLNRVTDKDIYKFDYKARFPRSRRELAQEEVNHIMELCGGLISSVTDRYGRTTTR